MEEGTLPVGVGEFAEHEHPALVERIEQGERGFDGSALRLGQFGPEILHVGLDGGLVFGERQLETDVRVHVAIGNVMSDLAEGPAAIAIGSIELLVGKSAEGGTQSGGSLLDVVLAFLFLFDGERARVGEFSDGIARVSHVNPSEKRR
jgi:hypothetical protein